MDLQDQDGDGPLEWVGPGLASVEKTDVSAAVICPVSAEDIYPFSTEDETAAGLRPAAVMSSIETG